MNLLQFGLLKIGQRFH